MLLAPKAQSPAKRSGKRTIIASRLWRVAVFTARPRGKNRVHARHGFQSLRLPGQRGAGSIWLSLREAMIDVLDSTREFR